MANLIITVISIALVAVAALMGAYYGGSAFMEGQAKANANTLASQAEQISAALTMAAFNNTGGSIQQYSETYGSGSDALLAQLVTHNTLSAVPKPPANVSTGSWLVGLFASGLNLAQGGIMLEMTNKKACEAVSKMARGNSATALVVDGSTSPPDIEKMECFCDDGNGDNDSTCDDGELLYFYYRIQGFNG